ncbi:MAG: hypothetical protein IJ677_06470 [Alphaproteobacteria bacterium]|nr:hypothetical protein [Alphaproteobacteria bacterium]
MKEICAAKTNALVANNKMNQAVMGYNANHKCQLINDGNVMVARVIISSRQTFGKQKTASSPKDTKKNRFINPTGVPFLCFMKNVNANKTIIVGIESGKADIVDRRNLSVRHKDMKTFQIKGVRYHIKDTVNGLPRFTAHHDTAPRRNKLNINSEELREIDF